MKIIMHSEKKVYNLMNDQILYIILNMGNKVGF